jgi:hypothetical protein
MGDPRHSHPFPTEPINTAVFLIETSDLPLRLTSLLSVQAPNSLFLRRLFC